MRTIKFRGRDFAGTWWYGFLSSYEGNPVIHPIQCVGSSILVEEETVGQFTGLVDSEGNEIYEGDILFCPSGDPNDFYIVEWSLNGFRVSSSRDRSCGFYDGKYDFIIDNIHDNPKLEDVGGEKRKKLLELYSQFEAELMANKKYERSVFKKYFANGGLVNQTTDNRF